jgi:hypothetical protein
MNKEVRSALIEVARNRIKNYIHYQELSDKCDLRLNMRDNPHDRLEIGRILGEISEFEYDNGRPLLSALVITKGGEEGDGFFKLCESLGMGSWNRLKRDPAFAASHMNKCYDFWLKNDNYKKYKDI